MTRPASRRPASTSCAALCIGALVLSLVMVPPDRVESPPVPTRHATVSLQSVVTDLRATIAAPSAALIPVAGAKTTASATGNGCGWDGTFGACWLFVAFYLLVIAPIQFTIQNFVDSVKAFWATIFPPATATPAAVRAAAAADGPSVAEPAQASAAPARPTAHRSPRIRPTARQPLVLSERVIRVAAPAAKAKAAASAPASRSVASHTRAAGATGRSARAATD